MRAATSLQTRLAALDWDQLHLSLDARGFAVTGPLLQPHECHAVRQMYSDGNLFRSRVIMARHGFGSGEYQYFKYPLPAIHQTLRQTFYPALAQIANRWQEAQGLETLFPQQLDEMLARCRAAGQSKPTPLLLKYSAGDYNCLHQDLYGEHAFPIQVVILLSHPGIEFTGGELVLVEQRPRMQSKPQVVQLAQGEAVIFAVSQRPKQGTRGTYKVTMRHGVSEVLSGQRFTTGLIFHDAA
jgi:uncharacterized protein